MESGNRLEEPKSSILWLFCVALFLFFIAGGVRAETLGFSLYHDPAVSRGDIQILVLDATTGTPVAEAQVSGGTSLATDPTTQTSTSLEGRALLRVPGDLPRTFTVSKSGYTTLSIAGVKSSAATIYLRPYPTLDILTEGRLQGFPPANDDSQILTGIVFKTLNIFDLINFSVQSLLSPLKDEIDVMGPRKIPSNLVLPEQKVSFLFASFTLNKPIYRLPLNAATPTRLAGAQGIIKVSDAMGLANGFKLEFLNKIRFTRVGLSESFVPGHLGRSMDFTAGQELSLYHRVFITRPPFQADVLTASFIDLDGNREILMPTDLKVPLTVSRPAVSADEISLSSTERPMGKNRVVITLAMADKGRRLSGIYSDNAGVSVRPGAFLSADPIESPKQLPAQIRISAPTQGIGTLTFNSPSPEGVLSSTPLWKIFVLPSAGDVQVPTRNLGTGSQVQSYSILKLDFGSGFSETQIDSLTVMRSLNRFSSAIAKIGGKAR